MSSSTQNILPRIGEVVVAKVEDFGGSLNDPIVEFSVTRGSEKVRAVMSSKDLSQMEKLALQVGAVMQVYVTKADDHDVRVSLKSPGGTPVISNASITSRPLTSEGNRVVEKKPIPEKALVTKKKEPSAPIKVPEILLNNLRTGMKLEGVVASSTSYAVFVNCKAFRKGKAGKFAGVNGMLHKSEIPKDILKSHKPADSSSGILEQGTPLTVYVREVWKNSGRFTLSLDPNISKEKVLELKERVRQDGKDRRRSRRLRRLLETVRVGTSATGEVSRVTSEGIFVTLTSLGPLDVTGFINKLDLPKQYEVPPDLRESFQKQLLEQDFKTGRKLLCSISKVIRNPDTKAACNINLQFEEFVGTDAVDELDLSNIKLIGEDEVDDSADTDEVTNKIDNDEDDGEEEEEENDEEDEDLRDIFDELRGSQPLLPVRDLMDWGDVQDMISDGSLKKAVLNLAIERVGAKIDGFLSYKQFSELIGILQDVTELGDDEDVIAYFEAIADNDVDETEDEGEVEPETAASSSKSEVVIMKKEETHEPVAEEDDDDGDSVEAMTEELFDELREESETVTVAKFKAWPDVKELLDSKLITSEYLDEVLARFGVKKTINLEQFSAILEDIDEKAAEADGPQDDATDEADEEDSEDDDEAEEIFDELRGDKKTITVAQLKSWSGIQDLLEEKLITAKYLDEALKRAGVKTTINLDQFTALLEDLDEAAALADDRNENTSAGGENNDDDADMEDDENEEDDARQEIFDELRGKSATVSIQAFKNWEEVKEIIDEKLLPVQLIDDIVSEHCKDQRKGLTFEQFQIILDDLDYEIDKVEGGESKDDDDDDDLSEEELAEMRKELFDELRGSRSTVSVETFLEWDELKEMINEGVITLDQIKSFLSDAKVKKELNFDQLNSVIEAIDEITVDEAEETDEEEDEEDEEEVDVATARTEAFDTLRKDKQTVLVKDFLAWDEVKEMIDEEVIEENEIKDFIEDLGISMKGQLTFSQFNSVLDFLDAAEEGEGDGNDDSIDFDKYRGSSPLMSLESFCKMDDIADLIEGEVIDKDEVREIFASVAKNPNQGLNLSEFTKVKNIIDDLVTNSDIDSVKMTPEEIEDMARDIFDTLRGDKKTVSVATFLAWDEIQEMKKEGFVTDDDVDEWLVEVNAKRNSDLNFDQFVRLVKIIEGFDEEAEENPLDEGLELTSVDAKNAYERLKGKAKALTIDSFKTWDFVQESLDEGFISSKTLNILIDEVTESAKTQTLTLDQFKNLVNLIQGSRQLISEKNQPSAADALDDDEEVDDDFGDLSEEEIEKMRRSIFDELKSEKSGLITTEALLSWESIQDAITSGDLTKKEVLAVIKSVVGTKKTDGMNYNQFSKVIGILDGDEDEVDEVVKPVATTPTAGKGFGTPSPAATKAPAPKKKDSSKETPSPVDELTRQLFDELRGNKETLSVTTFKESKDMKELLDSGALKHSSLEKAIVKVGVHSSGQMTYVQFNDLLNIINELTDFESSQFSDKAMEAQAASDEDGDEVNNEDEDDDDVLAREIYNELKGTRDALPLVDFIKWEDVQELLDTKALSEDNLADSITKAGIENEVALLSFEQFSDLLQIVDTVVDKSKLPVVDEEAMEELFVSEDVKAVSPSKKVEVASKEIATTESATDEEDDIEDGEDEVDDEGEIEQMFNELAKGKDFVTEKALKNWPDVKEMIDSGLVTKKTVAEYQSKIVAKDGKVSYDEFRKYVKLLDTVLVDENGEVLDYEDKNRAVNLDDLLE